MEIDYYDILGVSPSADIQTIRSAFRERAKYCHPDKGGSNDQMALLVEAWEILSDPISREHFDRAREASDQASYRAATADSIKARAKARRNTMNWSEFNLWLDGFALMVRKTIVPKWIYSLIIRVIGYFAFFVFILMMGVPLDLVMGRLLAKGLSLIDLFWAACWIAIGWVLLAIGWALFEPILRKVSLLQIGRPSRRAHLVILSCMVGLAFGFKWKFDSVIEKVKFDVTLKSGFAWHHEAMGSLSFESPLQLAKITVVKGSDEVPDLFALQSVTNGDVFKVCVIEALTNEGDHLNFESAERELRDATIERFNAHFGAMQREQRFEISHYKAIRRKYLINQSQKDMVADSVSIQLSDKAVVLLSIFYILDADCEAAVERVVKSVEIDMTRKREPL